MKSTSNDDRTNGGGASRPAGDGPREDVPSNDTPSDTPS